MATSTSTGLLWPYERAPAPAKKSKYSTPSSSTMVEPRAVENTAGQRRQ